MTTEINEILNSFGKTTGITKRGYHKFIREGLQMEKRQEFSWGGVIRSYGGWEKVKKMVTIQQSLSINFEMLSFPQSFSGNPVFLRLISKAKERGENLMEKYGIKIES